VSGRSDRKRPRRVIIADEVQLVKVYQAGATLKQLAVRYGVNHRTAAAVLGRAIVKSRHTRLSSIDIAQAISLNRSGLSLSAVAEALGGCANSIRNHPRKAGVAIRDSHGRP
jgi:hypothetical protein